MPPAFAARLRAVLPEDDEDDRELLLRALDPALRELEDRLLLDDLRAPVLLDDLRAPVLRELLELRELDARPDPLREPDPLLLALELRPEPLRALDPLDRELLLREPDPELELRDRDDAPPLLEAGFLREEDDDPLDDDRLREDDEPPEALRLEDEPPPLPLLDSAIALLL